MKVSIKAGLLSDFDVKWNNANNAETNNTTIIDCTEILVISILVPNLLAPYVANPSNKFPKKNMDSMNGINPAQTIIFKNWFPANIGVVVANKVRTDCIVPGSPKKDCKANLLIRKKATEAIATCNNDENLLSVVLSIWNVMLLSNFHHR